MRKVFYGLLLLANVSYAVENGLKMKQELGQFTYQLCMADHKLDTIVRILNIDRTPFCQCMQIEMIKEFDKSHLEQRYNSNSISYNEFQQEMSKIGGIAGKYCGKIYLQP
ncbi:hypothetical protein [Phocoenobacter skyensis]|uniref:Uncharacterized protein n=1 Tax=Phocoenobacter skyensis TaxID=97481 RepID=A0A1H7UHW1_9PAST|nr:hypothetical protein [Pasteurella skyensis]MDP8169842.1 hypothetical protein [Pasteurella skyensis]MDP8174016.1 hypothetical protein [Pasteurella skyensis]MDP8184553.1 hypothetical protein [Pasteurella skyensis]QLB23627.1 hypothetical protein A6B44_10640 [Pasteurella skyensis]SEL96399.1 hypothetical protein SAMN05444853_10273 [Pasteurella skyensis]